MDFTIRVFKKIFKERYNLMMVNVNESEIQSLVTGVSAVSLASAPASLPTSKEEEDVIRIAVDIFGHSGGKLPESVKYIVRGYIPVEASQISPFKSLLPSFVDLSDRGVLKDHLASPFQGLSDKLAAMRIVKSNYETRPYYLRKDQKNGFAFPLDTEVLSYAMKFIKEQEVDTTVCEIACAKGENGILLAYAGAKQVIFNDIDEDSIANLRNQITELPSQLKRVCKIDEGSCFGLLQRNPELENTIGLIFCRNLIHFFNKKEQVSFFELIKKMLKPGGRAILIANSVYSHGKVARENQLDQSDSSSFNLVHCLVYDRDRSSNPIDSIYQSLTECSESLVSGIQYKDYYLYEKDYNTGMKWQSYKETFKKLDKTIQQKVKEKIKEIGKEIAKINRGAVKVLSSHVRLYNPINLMKLFEKHEFDIAETFIINRKGHLLSEKSDPFEEGQQIGIIVSKPL